MENDRIQANIDNIEYFIKNYGRLKKKNFKVKLFGVGTFGCDIADKIASKNIKNIDMYGLSCNKQLLQTCSNLKNKILIGKNVTEGLGCGGSNEIAEKAFLSLEKRIKKLMSDTHILFVVIAHDSTIGKNSVFHFVNWANELGVALFIISLPPEKSKIGSGRGKLDVRTYNLEGHTLFSIPHKLVTKNLNTKSTIADFRWEFTNITIEQIFKGILKRIVNIDNIYRGLK